MKTEERQEKDEEKANEKREVRAVDEHGGGKVKRETRSERDGKG